MAADTHKVLSKSATFTLQPADDMTVQPVFGSETTTAWFWVNGDYIYQGLAAAMDAVASVANKTVVLANTATLPAGNYTIPAGVTLLIPFDNNNTLYTDEPEVEENTRTNPSLYRKLTMASGAHITVNGAISLSAKQAAQNPYSGVPSGSLSFIDMKSDSTITVNSGANLYVWGYITGSGAVTIKNGGKVYEDFQIT
jgi:hypothetical protein